MVYIEGTHLSTDRPTKKLDDRRFGPFRVLEKVDLRAFHIQLPPTWKKVHPVFHVSLLRPAKPTPSDVQRTPAPPPAVSVDGKTEYAVERILDSRLYRHKLQYHVKWMGYGMDDSTWESEENIQNSPEAVADFHRRHPSAPRRIAAVLHDLSFRPYENFTDPLVPPSQTTLESGRYACRPFKDAGP